MQVGAFALGGVFSGVLHMFFDLAAFVRGPVAPLYMFVKIAIISSIMDISMVFIITVTAIHTSPPQPRHQSQIPPPDHPPAPRLRAGKSIGLKFCRSGGRQGPQVPPSPLIVL